MKQSISDYKQSMYNFFVPTSFFIAACLVVYALLSAGIIKVTSIGFSDILIVALASFRLIRLFCFDSIFAYVREAIAFKSKLVTTEGGEKYIERSPAPVGFRRSLTALLDCPWCIGVWTTLICAILYTFSPVSALLVVLLSVASIATFFQLLAGLIGAKYEECDMRNEQLRK